MRERELERLDLVKSVSGQLGIRKIEESDVVAVVAKRALVSNAVVSFALE